MDLSSISVGTPPSGPPPVFAPDPVRPRHAQLIFDHAHRIVHASPNLRDLLGLPSRVSPPSKSADPSHEAVKDLLALAFGSTPETADAIHRWLNRAAARPATTVPSRLPLLTLSGARAVHATLSPVGTQYWIANFEDVTLRLDPEAPPQPAIDWQDRLTGIGNRTLFEHRLDTTLAHIAAGSLESATVLFLDLDRFKAVNDTLGHAIGDSLLRLVSERLQSSLRESDTLARLGGDEFAILLSQPSGPEIASGLAARIIDLLQRPYLIDGQVINIGASIGIAVAPSDGAARDQLLKSADLALYHSKAAGRGVFHFFEPAMEEKAQRRRALEMDLRKAVVLRQFELHYQPQIDTESQAITSLEGLLRWRHPQRGLLYPAEFLSLAEEIGLAVPIGDWVLKTACKEARRWPGVVTVAVNLSPLQFEMGKCAASVERALTAAGLPGSRLEIEVTEDILLRDGETILATLDALRLLGVRVAMDSFGTGLASLSQLVNFPFDKIKIDRSLLDMQQNGTKHRAVVRAISALGESLGIATLAEGVENSEQLASVRSEGCHSVQGFYYSKAVPASELLALFSNPVPAAASAQTNPQR